MTHDDPPHDESLSDPRGTCQYLVAPIQPILAYVGKVIFEDEDLPGKDKTICQKILPFVFKRHNDEPIWDLDAFAQGRWMPYYDYGCRVPLNPDQCE